jgi:hypothetical protein
MKTQTVKSHRAAKIPGSAYSVIANVEATVAMYLVLIIVVSITEAAWEHVPVTFCTSDALIIKY